MPLEISEIGVHVAVGPNAAPKGSSATPAPASGGQGLTPAQHQEIVNSCVQQVLRNLRQMQER